MKLRKAFIIWLLFCYSFTLVFHESMLFVSGRVPVDFTTVTDDGDISAALVRDDSSTVIEIDIANGNHGYMEFNTSALPSNSVILGIEITFTTQTVTNPGVSDVDGYQLEFQPYNNSNTDVYADTANGTKYEEFDNLNSNTEYTYDLGATAVSDLQSHLTWFGLGLVAPGLNNQFFYSSESSYPPYLTIEYYTTTDSTFTFTGVFYENGTSISGDYTIYSTDGFSESFGLNQNSSTQYYPANNDPDHWTWDLGTTTRYLYYIGANENFTVTVPESTYSLYSFYIKDYTLRIGNMDAWLEAWRMVNATETLIERQVIYDQVNPVPLNLVVGKVYIMKIRFSDGTLIELGYFTPTATTSHTFQISQYEWGDRVQTAYNDITAEATRPNATHIQLSYQELIPGYSTIYANMSICLRNGTEITRVNSTGVSETILHWYSAGNTTDYIVKLYAEVGYYGEIYKAWLLDAPQTYTSFGSWSNNNLTAFILGLIIMGGFSYASRMIAPFAGVSVLAVCTALGLASFTVTQLGIGYAFCFIWGLVVGET